MKQAQGTRPEPLLQLEIDFQAGIFAPFAPYSRHLGYDDIEVKATIVRHSNPD